VTQAPAALANHGFLGVSWWEWLAIMDGANAWQLFRKVTFPMLRPALFLVLTLGLIGTWQVFDQIYLMSQGNPAGTTLTPAYLAYLAYLESFGNQQWGQGAAIAFILFAIIVVLTIVQRFIVSERSVTGGRV
jgi:multiple sugar transport system permease protein